MAKQKRSGAGVAAAQAFAALLLAVAFCAQAAWAQSGRKGQKASTPPPAEAEPTPQGESESGPKRSSTAKPDALVSFVVMRGDDSGLVIFDPLARDGVMQNFMRRLGQSSAVEVSDGGKGRRQDARERAKSERTAYVVLFEMEEENYAGGGVGRADSRSIVLKTYVYTPKAADLKYTDTIYQRPYRQTARIGGVRVPVPTSGIERYPSQHELEQAARDAADRLLARFHINPPPDN